MDLSKLDDVFEKIRKAEIPAVIIGREAEGFITIDSDDEADMEKIAEHLITVHGLTQIDIVPPILVRKLASPSLSRPIIGFTAHIIISTIPRPPRG